MVMQTKYGYITIKIVKVGILETIAVIDESQLVS